MKLTILNENAVLEGVRVINKPVKITTYTENNETVEHSVGGFIHKIVGKTFEGMELENYVKIDLNKPVYVSTTR